MCLLLKYLINFWTDLNEILIVFTLQVSIRNSDILLKSELFVWAFILYFKHDIHQWILNSTDAQKTWRHIQLPEFTEVITDALF